MREVGLAKIYEYTKFEVLASPIENLGKGF